MSGQRSSSLSDKIKSKNTQQYVSNTEKRRRECEFKECADLSDENSK
jgi:hypothetical protein